MKTKAQELIESVIEGTVHRPELQDLEGEVPYEVLKAAESGVLWQYISGATSTGREFVAEYGSRTISGEKALDKSLSRVPRLLKGYKVKVTTEFDEDIWMRYLTVKL